MKMIAWYVWLLAVVVGLVLSFLRFPRLRVVKCINKLPGPRGAPIIGVALNIVSLQEKDILNYFGSLMKSYKRIAAFWTCGIPHVLLQDPDDIERVLSSTFHIRKGVEYDPLRVWLNEGLLVSEGNKWKRRRKLLTPAFHFRILHDSLQSFNKHSFVLAEKLLKSNGPVNILDYAKRCAMDALCDAVMGVPIDTESTEGDKYLKAVKRMTEIIITRELTFWLYSVPIFYFSPIGFESRRVQSVLQNFTNEVIEERRRNIVENQANLAAFDKKRKKVFLDILIEHSLNHPGSLTLDDIREEVDTFMFEGHDTTSSALNFSFFCLGTYKDAQEKVIQELDLIFGSSKRQVEMEDLSKMTYLDQFIKEVMRLYPPVPYLSRLLENDLDLKDGLSLPEGTNVIMIPYLMHRDPNIFKDPEVFDPERFSDKASANMTRNPFAYVPFSAGPRNCIGQKFAMMELKVIIANVLRHARINTLTSINDFNLLPLLILKSDLPIQIEVVPRCDN